MLSKLVIKVVNKTGGLISPSKPTWRVTPSCRTYSAPKDVAANNTESGGVFTFDQASFTVMCAYRSPVPQYIWILYVQTCEGKDPILRTTFCPEPKDLESIFTNVLKRGLRAYNDSLSFPDAEDQTLYLATCNVCAPNETEPDRARTVEFKLWEWNPSKSPSHSPSERPPEASSPRSPRPPSKISIQVANRTRSDIDAHPGVAWATVPGGLNVAPPENIAAETTGPGGRFDFNPELCAISAYVTPDSSCIWVLFVRAFNNGIVAKTAFYHMGKGIDQITVNDIDCSGVFKDTAMHAFTAVGLDVAFLATCQVGDAEFTGSELVLSVHFELTAIPKRAAESALNGPSRVYRGDEGSLGSGGVPFNRASKTDERRKDGARWENTQDAPRDGGS